MKQILFWMLFSFACTASAQWTTVPGQFTQISVASDGTVVGLSGSYTLSRRVSDQWQLMTGSLTQVSAGSATNIWGVNSLNANAIYRWNGTAWTQIPGRLRQVSAAADGTVWGTDIDDAIYRWDQPTSKWVKAPGTLRVVSAGTSSEVWGVGTTGLVYRWNGTAWDQKPGQISAISVSGDKSVWCLGLNAAAFRWNGTGWDTQNGAFTGISVGGASNVWTVASSGVISKYTPSMQITDGGTISVDPSLVNPTLTLVTLPPPGPAYIIEMPVPGKTVCMNETCTTAKAEYVGAYTLNTKCSTGFYDMIYGGTCWKCPDDDGHGAWIRSTDAITKDTACWRAPKDYTTAATKVKSTAWAWDCASGTFWDGYSGGGCWTCPADFPRRTLAAVYASNACVSPVNETKPAALITYNGCPTPSAATMKKDGKLPGLTMPGKPFLDIAGGAANGDYSGGCFTCPTVDELGNITISERNAAPIYGDNQGCTVRMKYQATKLPKPGISGLFAAGTGSLMPAAAMPVAKQFLVDNGVLNASLITKLLHAAADDKGYAKDSAQARTFVAQQWQAVVTSPFRSSAVRLAILGALKTALGKAPSARTPAETVLIAGFEKFINAWRVNMAQTRLDMYDSWAAWDANWRATHAVHPMVKMFDYGTVPFDFMNATDSLMVLGASGVSVAGAIGAFEAFGAAGPGATADDVISNSLYSMLRAGNLVASVSKGIGTLVSITVGANLIAGVFAVITNVAFDQFVAIITGRDKLVTSLAQAKVPITLASIMADAQGSDLFQFYWLQATDTTNEYDDDPIRMVALQEFTKAQATGFARIN